MQVFVIVTVFCSCHLIVHVYSFYIIVSRRFVPIHFEVACTFERHSVKDGKDPRLIVHLVTGKLSI